mmetsp:Transcript_6877/g.29023  ORF Transcript_6877/g.29023 Transcript_6877/m.29023 type:complete len:145 (-) Transcript_6877:112-546(-)
MVGLQEACMLARALEYAPASLREVAVQGLPPSALLPSRQMGDAGAQALAPALAAVEDLCELSIEQHRIGDAGAQAMAQLLRKHRRLEVLKLPDNEVGPDGAWALVEALMANERMRRVELGGNKRIDRAARELLQRKDLRIKFYC